MSIDSETDSIVDEKLQNYIAARSQSDCDSAQFAGKWVARRKSDARVVADAETYDGLEDALASAGIDSESVVLGVVPEPGDIHVV